MLIPSNLDTNILPFDNEKPSEYADRLGISYASRVNGEYKKKLGQFFTPLPIAKFMSEFAVSTQDRVKILDPGCGIGILSIALAEDFININSKIKTIDLVAFETDVNILPIAEACFSYLQKWLSSRGVKFNYFLCKNDFILHNSQIISGVGNSFEEYDLIVSNPPYFKLPKEDIRSIAAQAVIYGQTNIYSIFLLISAKLLKPGGKLIFITPRSFCSGSYFRMFREQFFSLVDIKNIHLFNSRTSPFKRDKVLQETLIIAASAKVKSFSNQLDLPLDLTNDQSIIISSSSGMSDLNQRSWMFYSWNSLMDENSFQKTLHLPSNDQDDYVISVFRRWNNTLHKLGWEISTGRVVDFRSLKFIVTENIENTVPLFWLHNINMMSNNWPDASGAKGKNKAPYFLNTNDSIKLLVPNTNYILLRRFSSKDDARKLIAAPYLCEMMPNYKSIGIENHLNYIYKLKGMLTKYETLGLAALLNSTLYDIYFRTFNGNINVSATELRDIKLPDVKLINEIGESISKGDNMKQSEIDKIVSKYLKIEL